MNKQRNEWRRNLLLIIPAHHIGSYKYEYPPEPDNMKTSSIKQEEIQLESKNYQNIGSNYVQSPKLNHKLIASTFTQTWNSTINKIEIIHLKRFSTFTQTWNSTINKIEIIHLKRCSNKPALVPEAPKCRNNGTTNGTPTELMSSRLRTSTPHVRT